MYGQKVTTIDIVKTKLDDLAEAHYFYENNWKAFRQAALTQGYITGYRMLQSEPDTTGFITLTLMTEYADSAMYQRAEEHFRPIMTAISPDGPKYLTNRKNRDFLTYEYGTDGRHVWDSSTDTAASEEVAHIAATLNDYIEGSANSDPERLRRAFHPDFNLYTVSEKDSLWVRDGEAYIAGFEPGKRLNRTGRILDIDYEKDAASAKVEIVVPGWRIFTDYFLLLKYEGAWKIVQKSYTWRAYPKE